MVVPIQPRGEKGWFMLPQAPEQAGYYVYGNVRGVAGTGHLAQYAHANMLSVIFWVEREWQAVDHRKFGIGNISVSDGSKYDHGTHMSGIEMDIRPVRKDKVVGPTAGCSYRDTSIYDQAATIKLVRIFLKHPMTRTILFNDPEVQKACGPRVKSWKKHDHHLHIAIRENLCPPA